MDNQYLLSMSNITKEYYGNRVLKNVNLNVKPGEIHALVGENGAGKSTLMNILFGMPVIFSTGGFEGQIYLGGEPTTIDSPHTAMDRGIGMVHQEFMLIPEFTVTENIKLGREIGEHNALSKIFGPLLDKMNWKQMSSDARKALDSIGMMNIEEYAKVAGMPIGYKQFVEIAREIDKTGIKLLVFDEPTAVLTESEADRLLEIMRIIANKGIAIIFITHRLTEVMAVADSMTILRDGEFVARKEVGETSLAEMAELMIGRQVEKLVDDDLLGERKLFDDRIALEFKDYYVDMPGERVRGMDVKIRTGEIFGFGGLAGQGKIGIANGIMGLYDTEGEVIAFGKTLDLSKLGEALRNGLAFVSEDRRGVGLLLGESIERNIIFSAMQINDQFLRRIGPMKILDKANADKHAKNMIRLLDIRCTGPSQVVGSLSGGNQQKVCLARALTMVPKILIVSEPTRGIDIGAKKLVLEYLTKINRELGTTIVMISSELVELRSLCDRIAIVSEGKVFAIMKPDDPDAAYGLAMAGVREEVAS
ncbi:MAG: sugar ABC transporter ATP-binding protein [Anaerolineaceae bacterium]|nr:sugar ABC transporter ATP-binding protein [Anaerolineaceae bacterium]MDD4043147.1 sugar ABC transporter ATP-binding protein [Anaerolineaceae bacterium]MDD4577883.1 sugar ABC transporter ATP-binding protein [Anaerolineaceae bacterium]